MAPAEWLGKGRQREWPFRTVKQMKRLQGRGSPERLKCCNMGASEIRQGFFLGGATLIESYRDQNYLREYFLAIIPTPMTPGDGGQQS